MIFFTAKTIGGGNANTGVGTFGLLILSRFTLKSVGKKIEIWI
jgi:hypothetical protein